MTELYWGNLPNTIVGRPWRISVRVVFARTKAHQDAIIHRSVTSAKYLSYVIRCAVELPVRGAGTLFTWRGVSRGTIARLPAAPSILPLIHNARSSSVVASWCRRNTDGNSRPFVAEWLTICNTCVIMERARGFEPSTLTLATAESLRQSNRLQCKRVSRNARGSGPKRRPHT